jgi:hypothetical protein
MVVVVVVVGHYRSSSVVVVVVATVAAPGVILEVAAIVHCCLHVKESQPAAGKADEFNGTKHIPSANTFQNLRWRHHATLSAMQYWQHVEVRQLPRSRPQGRGSDNRNARLVRQ